MVMPLARRETQEAGEPGEVSGDIRGNRPWPCRELTGVQLPVALLPLRDMFWP